MRSKGEHAGVKSACQMSVSMTPTLEKMVRAEVESGSYATPSEVIREALRHRYGQELNAAVGARAPKKNDHEW